MNIKTFGLEQEFFVKNAAGEYVSLHKGKLSVLPHDHCGYLAEARATHAANPWDARWLLRSSVGQLEAEAKELGLVLLCQDNATDFPKELQRICLRENGKDPSKAYFMGGGCYRDNKPRAGLHVHFGNERTFSNGEYKTHVAEQMNMPRIIWLMDRAFKEEIKAAKRIPGENEMKGYGFEYRSLPTTVNLDKLINVLLDIRAD